MEIFKTNYILCDLILAISSLDLIDLELRTTGKASFCQV
jgi:hypothetical protein